jgi:hypothetical protein
LLRGPDAGEVYGVEPVDAASADGAGDLAFSTVGSAGHALQTTECIGQVSTRRTGTAGLADFGSTSCADRTGGDGVAGLAAGATGYTGAADIEEPGLADTGDVVGAEGPVAELVALLADIDTGEGDDGALNALWVDVGALAVDAETVDGQVGVVDVL